MTVFQNEGDEESVVQQLQTWLGIKGIQYFQDVKELHGTLDAVWMEPVEADMIPQYIPRSIDSQEGKSLRTFMKTLDECKDWKEKDFEEQWMPVLEKCIDVE